MEAIGGFEVLAAAEIPIVIVHPRQVRDFARSTGQLAKTDAINAHILDQVRYEHRGTYRASRAWPGPSRTTR